MKPPKEIAAELARKLGLDCPHSSEAHDCGAVEDERLIEAALTSYARQAFEEAAQAVDCPHTSPCESCSRRDRAEEIRARADELLGPKP